MRPGAAEWAAEYLTAQGINRKLFYDSSYTRLGELGAPLGLDYR